MRIFLDDRDYRKFVYLLGDMVQDFNVECWDYCLMPNHYHLTVRTRSPNLSSAIRYLNSVYALWWNATHSRVGHVFQGRFKDQIVQREGYLRSLCRYIALNPVRGGLVDHPEQWPWSSFRAIAGSCRDPGFLLTQPVLAQFGDGEVGGLRERYMKYVLAVTPDDEQQVERLRSNERIVGDRSFKLQVIGDGRAQTVIREPADREKVESTA